MPNQYPDKFTSKILQITLDSRLFAYLAVDQAGVIVDQGGDLSAMGLPDWKPGEAIVDSAFFLSGMLPMSNQYEHLPSVQSGDSNVIDIHLFQDAALTWAILEDKSEELEWQELARQKANELALLEHEIQNRSEGESIVAEVATMLQSLNLVGLVYQGNGNFEAIKPAAPIFADFYNELFSDTAILRPQQRFLFLESFLGEAQVVWNSNESFRRIRSGPWIDKTSDGGEVTLEAIALNWQQHPLLLIEVLEENYQQQHRILQVGREGILAKDELAIKIRQHTRQVREREEEIALRLVSAADSRDDGETGSHIRRLGLYSELMARHLGWPQDSIDAIRIAAPMHDIGKIGIPDQILKKPGKLNEDEFEIMKSHSEIGARILSNSSSELVKMACDIALGHHERWDGTGYPFGQSGFEIALSARIVAIVDVFDALIHKRIYKKEMSVDEALEIMLKERSKHFDPELLDLFVDLREDMEKIAYDFANPIAG